MVYGLPVAQALSPWNTHLSSEEYDPMLSNKALVVQVQKELVKTSLVMKHGQAL